MLYLEREREILLFPNKVRKSGSLKLGVDKLASFTNGFMEKARLPPLVESEFGKLQECRCLSLKA